MSAFILWVRGGWLFSDVDGRVSCACGSAGRPGIEAPDWARRCNIVSTAEIHRVCATEFGSNQTYYNFPRT